MIKKLFSHTLIYGLAPHISKIASFFVLPIVTQYLTPVDYGVYGIITATIGSISVFASLGMRVVLVNSFYKSPNYYKWQWRQIYGFLSLWIIPFAIISSILLYFIVPEEAKENVFTIILINIMPAIFFGQTSTLATTYYQINKKPYPIAVRTAVFGTLTVLLNLYTIAVLRLGYMGWFWSTFIIGVLNNFSYWIPLNFKLGITPIFNFKWRLIWQNLKVSLPTVPHYYSAYLLNTSDKLVLKFLNVSTASIGQYNVAYTFGNYFSSLGIAAGLAVGPMLNECYKKGEEMKARNLVFLLQIIFFSLSFMVSIWLKELFHFFIRNESLSQMYYLGVVIVMSYNYRPMYMGSINKIFYTEKTKILWRISFIAGASNVVLNLVLVSFFGYEAAAFTTFASLMYMGYAGYFLKTFKENNTVDYFPLRWLLATIMLTVLAYFVVMFHPYIKLLISGILLPLILYILLRMKKVLYESK